MKPAREESKLWQSTAHYVEGLCNVAWYTADPSHPYLIKASATVEYGYQILITDLKDTYFCAGDNECIKNEKKVEVFLSTILEVQPYY